MNVHLIPEWFFGAHIVFQLSFMILTAIIGVYAANVYKITKQKQVKLFSVAFILFALHYLIQSTLNFFIYFNLISGEKLMQYGTYSHMLIFTLGLIALLSLVLGIKKKSTFSLITITSLVAVFFSTNKLYMFYLLASIFLVYISYFYLKNYLKNKDKTSLISFVAFVFLLFGNIHFLFSVNHETFYAIAHFLELIAYALIIINLKLIKNVQKKK